MKNVYEQISENKRRSFLIIFLFIAFIILTVYTITVTFNFSPDLFIFAAIFSLVSSIGSFYFGDKIVLSLNNAHLASRQEFFDFYTAVENLSLANRLPVPKIYVIDSPAPNAFATGRDPEHAVICATTGLLNRLNRTELEAVLAHELSHIKNFDTRLMMIVSLLIGMVAILADLSQRQLLFGRRSRDDNRRSAPPIFALIGLFLVIFSPIIAQLIQLAISRNREYFADASAVKLTRQPQGLIDALTKIAHDSQPLATASAATASLYITNPFKNKNFLSLFSTHPPIEKRLSALRQML